MVRLPAVARRQQLVESAVRLAARDGIDAVTTRSVARDAGVSLGIVHYCFESKDELLREMVRAIVDLTRDTAVASLRPGTDVRAALLAAGDALLLTIEPDNHLLTYELTIYALREPAAHDLAALLYSYYFSTAVEFFERLAEVGRISWTLPVPVIARMLTALTEGVTLAWLVDRDTAAARATYEAFVDYVVRLGEPVVAARH